MYEKKHALPNKKIHTPKGIARLTVTAATMAAMTGSSLISPFAAFAQTGDGGYIRAASDSCVFLAFCF